MFPFTSGQDACTGTYYTNAVPVVRYHFAPVMSVECILTDMMHDALCIPRYDQWQIDLQLAKQGYRLAAWLNVIFDGATNLP